jgi:hypothetical protein
VNDEFDPLDDTLADGLRALAPSEFTLDADRTLGEMRPRLRRARNQRRLAVTTSVLGALVVVVGGATLVRSDPSGQVDVRGGSQPSVSAPGPSTTTRLPPTTTTVPRNATTVPKPSATVPSGTPMTGNPTPTTPRTTPPPAAPQTKTYAAQGGRVTIRFANGRLTLVSSVPAPGFAAEVHNRDPDDVEVRFDNGDHESRIRVRVVNGRLTPEISEN